MRRALHIPTLLGTLLPACFAAACGGSSKSDAATSGAENGGDPTANPCGLDTGYDGDERCILPPDPAEGFQLHVGPVDHDDTEEIAKFLLDPNEETTECYYVKTANTEDVFYQRRSYRMRPGSHHLILKKSDTARDDGWGECPPGLGAAIGGTQRAVVDYPDGDLAPEDVGLASTIGANTQVAAELHFYNTSETPILREIWANFYYMAEADVKEKLYGVALIGGLGMAIEPGKVENVTNSCPNDLEGRRIVSLQGHAHAHTTRFSVWKHHGTDPRELVYEMFDWADPASLQYNSVVKNPASDPAAATAGGHTGQLFLAAGDQLEWECEVDNDSSVTLTFANEVNTAEMCNLFGSTLKSTIACFK